MSARNRTRAWLISKASLNEPKYCSCQVSTLAIPCLPEEETVSDRLFQHLFCYGLRCVTGDLPDRSEIAARDLIDPMAGIDFSETTLGSRDGFDTVTGARGSFDVTDSVPGVTVTSAPSVHRYGFWGEHGFAAVEIGAGPLSGRVDGIPFTGDIDIAVAYSLGNVNGLKPAGLGSASWTGIAEAVDTPTLRRHQGTATLTIPDLSRPRVSADIALSAIPIRPRRGRGWTGMSLKQGHFRSGERNDGEDYLRGHFSGPEHGEAYGVFRSGDFIGAFGAKRDK